MDIRLFFATLLTTSLSAGVVVPDRYFISEGEDISYIYSSEYEPTLEALKNYQKKIIKSYEEEYGYKLDNRLYVGLASSNNQIANGFSTQFPFNQQVFYGAGVGYIDYFCFSSWLKTLIIHESAHNFQLNPKYNDLSKISHKILGNTPFSFFSLIPLFPIPNVTESSFILEGNGVMNESRYGNGGRLFSGYALAEVVAMAKAGLITPELMYNPTLTFPYGEKFYLVGGFFQQFLVDKFGINRVNSYFKRYATQPFPFFTNWVFTEQFGNSFETLLSEFVDQIERDHASFTRTEGKILATSQSFVPLNRNSKEIYTLVSDQKSAPKVLKIDRATSAISYLNGAWRSGELFEVDGQYYTQSSAKTSPTKITMGLFDREGYLLKGTEGKVVQGYFSDQKMLYFDLLKSLESPHVFIDGKFITESHSSVYLHNDQFYYFKQEGEKRVLYNNREALFSYQGHYGFVTDISDDGGIYFIASTADGSSIYLLKDQNIERVALGDDIIDFKLLNSTTALVATVGSEGYSYRVIRLEEGRSLATIPSPNIVQKKISLQKENFKISHDKKVAPQAYNPVARLKKSSLYQAMNYSSYSGFGVDLQMNFSDPLMQNALSLPFSTNNERTILGLKYDNRAYPFEFGTAIYGLYNNKNSDSNQRAYGVDGYLTYPFLSKGYWYAESQLAYTKAYNNIYRTPLTLSLDIVKSQQFGVSKYRNSLNALSLFISRDRDSNIFGGSYAWEGHVFAETYLGLNASYLKSNRENAGLEKGIELSDTFTDLQSDKSSINIPSLSGKLYANEVKFAEVSLKKVFNMAWYSYSFPISLQRESLYFKERLYDIDFTKNTHQTYKESILGLEADLLFIHKLPLPIRMEYIYNPDVQNKKQVRVLFGGSF